jgi:hypothetical protein
MMEMRVNPQYDAMRIRELELTAVYLMKLQVEKEEAREERERLRERQTSALGAFMSLAIEVRSAPTSSRLGSPDDLSP